MKKFLKRIKMSPLWNKEVNPFFPVPVNRLTEVGFLFVLIPFSFELVTKIPVAGYHFRPVYFGAALCLAGVICKNPKKFFHDFFHSRTTRLWGAMAIPALIATFWVSANPHRSLIYGVWALATLLFVPRLAAGLARADKRVFRFFSIYLFLQALLIIFDKSTCALTQSHFTLGYKVFESGQCRPHGFYQEPNYFASIGLLSWFAIGFGLQREKSAKWKKFIRFLKWALALALVCSTSRLAWVGLPVLLVVEYFLLNPIESKKILSTAFTVLAGVIVGMVVYLKYNPEGLDPLERLLGSYNTRIAITHASGEVFQSSPWVGVGPGSAGAYLAEHFPGDPLFVYNAPESMRGVNRERFRDHPLSVQLPAEILSEWGVVGFLLFSFGLLSLLSAVSSTRRLMLLTGLMVISATWQTLPRFDFWFIFGLALGWGI